MKNEKEIKKTYVAPEVSVIEFEYLPSCLLGGSGYGDGHGMGLLDESSDIEHV